MKGKKIFSNPGLKLLSFVLAVLLWLVVANIEDSVTTKQFKDVTVEVINSNVISTLNKVYEIQSGETATFTIKGRRSVLDRLTSDDFLVTADLSHMSDVNAVPVTITPKNGALDIEVYKNENTVVVALEDELSSNFPVDVVPDGSVAEGYALGEAFAEPNIVTLTGPKSLIEKIDRVVASVDVEGKRSSIAAKSELIYYDKNGDVLDTNRVSANTANVDVKIQVLGTKTIPVKINPVGDVADGYSVESFTYEPQEIEIAGTSDVLDQIDELVINDISIHGMRENTDLTVKVSEYIPKNVVLVNPEQKIMITIKVGKIGMRTVTIKGNQIDCAGGSSKYRYTIDRNSEIKVTLRGFQDKISMVSILDLNPMINVSALSAGTFVQNVTVKEIDGVTVTVAGKVTVEVENVEE